MLKSETKKKVTTYIKMLIAQKINIKPEHINLNWVIDKDIKLDSIDKIEIEMELEDTYDIEFADDDINNFETISELIDLVVNKIWSRNK